MLLYHSKPVAEKYRKKRKRAKTTPEILFLKQRTFAGIYGYEDEETGIRYPNLTQQQYISRVQCKIYPNHIANWKLVDHAQGKDRYYFYGRPGKTAPETLVYGDVDCQKSKGLGSAAGSLAFVQYLRTNYFPNLHFERSRGGVGMAFYLVLEKLGWPDAAVNRILSKFKKALNALAAHIQADIEGCEIMGKLPERTYKYGMIHEMKSGIMGRFPLDAKACMGTTRIEIFDLSRLADDWLTRFPETKQTKVLNGNASVCFVSDEELANLPAYAKSMPKDLCAKIKGRNILAEDWAQFVLLMKLFNYHPSNNQAMPYRRIEMMWNEQYKAGRFSRAFCYQRYQVMRDYLSEHGHIQWLDNRYQNRRACKWRISKAMVEYINTCLSSSTSAESKLFPYGPHQHMRPRLAAIQVEDTAREVILIENTINLKYAA